MARVQQALGGTAPANTADGLKAGRPDLRVAGIATAPIASVDVIRRAKAAGCNLIVSCEPTFYARADDSSPANRANDPTFAAKRALDRSSRTSPSGGCAISGSRRGRPHSSTPSPKICSGRNTSSRTRRLRVVLPSMALRDLVAHVQRAARRAGDCASSAARICASAAMVLSPGPSAPAVTFTNLATADVILAGDPREWEGVEYVQDAITAGQAKAMVLVGRLLSENAGMREHGGVAGRDAAGRAHRAAAVARSLLETGDGMTAARSWTGSSRHSRLAA